MKMLMRIFTVVALSATIVQAELVGSLQIPPVTGGGVATNVTSFSSVTRTTNGTGFTRGQVEGTLWARGSHDPLVQAGYDGFDVKSFSENTPIGDLSRFAWNTKGGYIAWDFDFTGADTNGAYWNLEVDLETNGSGDPLHPSPLLYISYNDGAGLTLDTSNITNLTLNSTELYELVKDQTKYVPIGEAWPIPFPDPTPGQWKVESGAAYSNNIIYDITGIMTNAIANGGSVRLVMHDCSFKRNIKLSRASGFHNTTNAVGQPIVHQYLADIFDTASGTLPAGGWTGAGPEAKELNLAASGYLAIRDADADELGNGTHTGSLDSVTIDLVNELVLTNAGDVAMISLTLAALPDTSGAALPEDGSQTMQFSFVDRNAVSNAGFGIEMQVGYLFGSNTTTEASFLAYDDAVTPNTSIDFASLGGLGYLSYNEPIETVVPFDGTPTQLMLMLLKDDTGEWMVWVDWNNRRFREAPIKNPWQGNDIALGNGKFNRLTVTAGNADYAVRVDDVMIWSNVQLPDLTPYETWILDYPGVGASDAKTDDPDLDGVDNFTEWALGGDPDNILDIGIDSEFSSDGTTFTYIYPSNKDGDVQGVLYDLEVNDDLVAGTWTNDGVTVTVGGDHPSDADYVTVTNEVLMSGASEQFIRMEPVDTNP